MRKSLLFAAISMALGTGTASAGEAQTDGVRSPIELERISVRALPLERSKLDSAQPIDILAGEKLDDRRGLTIGETLQFEPGVHSTHYGPGAGRPIIRGLSGPRVRVLEDGLATADTSAQSDDHAVAVDPFLVDRIEVLRGPSTLLFGSGAVGGVVNLIDNRIPEEVPPTPFSGRYEIRGNSAADERSGAVRLNGGAGNFAWHVDGSYRDADDVNIPGRARADHGHGHDHDHDHDHGHDDDHDNGRGTLENSFVESRSGTIGASWVGQRGFLGASFRRFETEYGIPAPHEHGSNGHDDHGHGHHSLLALPAHDHDNDHGHDNDHDDEHVYVDLVRNRWDLKGGLMDPLPGFNRATLRVSYSEYTHQELEVNDHASDHDHGHGHANPLTTPAHDHDHDHDHGHDQGHDHTSTFDVETWQARLEMEHQPMFGFNGVFGAQFEDEDFRAIGAEAFVPDTRTRQAALFTLQERRFGDVTLSAGARVESTRLSPDGNEHDHDHDHGHGHGNLLAVPAHDHDHDHDHDNGHDHDDDHRHGPDRVNRSFTTWSASMGGVWHMNEKWQTSLNFSRAERAPSQTELYADGAHLATFGFELGDSDLTKEITHGWDVIVHRHSERFDFEVSLFHNDISDFIYLAETGEERNGLALRTVEQHNARFYGMETRGTWMIRDTGFGDVNLRASYDMVRGELTDGSNLPRMSPRRLGTGVDWYYGPVRASADWYRVMRQNRVAENETATSGYHMLNLNLGYGFDLAGMDMEAFVRGTNLANQEARAHTSYLKDFAPLTGRNFTLGLRGRF